MKSALNYIAIHSAACYPHNNAQQDQRQHSAYFRPRPEQEGDSNPKSMPGFPSKYSKELWQQARDLVSQGFTFPEVSDKTGIGLSNLKMKAQRDNWFVPVTALQKGKEALQHREGNKLEVCPSVTTDLVFAESVEEMGQKAKISALKGLLPVFTDTFKEGSVLLSQPVDNWKNAGSMTNIVSKLLGWDRPTVAIQTNVWGPVAMDDVLVESGPSQDDETGDGP